MRKVTCQDCGSRVEDSDIITVDGVKLCSGCRKAYGLEY